MEIKTINDYIMAEMFMGLSKEDKGLIAVCKSPEEYVVKKLVAIEEDLDDANKRTKYVKNIYREFISKKLGISLDEVDDEIRNYLEEVQIKDEKMDEDQEESQ